jgi:hypothetical protein
MFWRRRFSLLEVFCFVGYSALLCAAFIALPGWRKADPPRTTVLENPTARLPVSAASE